MEPETPSPEAIRRQLARVLASGGFARNERLSYFLRFIVERHLEQRDSELKESVLAVEVFGRKAGYDPKLDAIVRTEAVRLRARLDQYYHGEGREDPVLIELPKGGYRPTFRERAPAAETATAPAVPSIMPVSRRRSWLAAAAAFVLVAASGTWWWTQATRSPTAVAVLPLENLSKNPETDYLADGLTDEVIRNLSLIDGLTVRSRTSSFALKDKGLSAVDAGRQLDAEYLVEGSVLQAGDQLRVNVALVSARDGSRIWSNRYDRKITDIFAVQDEISRGIVNTLQLSLSGRRRYEANLEAYDMYLRGRQIMAAFPSRARPVALPAVGYFERAIEKDPNYALAYAGMADAFIAMERNIGPTSGKVNAWPRAKAAAARALELDPMLSEAHSATASIRAREYAWQDAERGFRRAIELNPNNALAHLELGARVLIVQGRVDNGLEEVGRALALDPLSPYVNTEAGEALLLAGRYSEAVQQFRKAIALDPSRTRPYNWMARALYLQGNIADALNVRDESLKRGMALAVDWAACLEVRAGRREQALVLLEEHRNSGRAARVLAKTYACLGQEEEALEALEKAFAENEPSLPELLQAPELGSLRRTPRFTALRQKMNLQP